MIKIGYCGFPVGKKKYFEAFKVVEIPQTFYQPPSVALAQKWERESPGNFEYTMKAWQLITHEPKSPTYKTLKTAIPKAKEKNYGSFKPTFPTRSYSIPSVMATSTNSPGCASLSDKYTTGPHEKSLDKDRKKCLYRTFNILYDKEISICQRCPVFCA